MPAGLLAPRRGGEGVFSLLADNEHATELTRQRTIWLLKYRRAGDLAQLRHLAALLSKDAAEQGGPGWTIEEKQLSFRIPSLVRTPAAARWLLDSKRSDDLRPPWPDAIIAAEGIATWVAGALKARAGGKTRLLVLGRPAGEVGSPELVLTTAQYGLPQTSTTVELPLPLSPAPPASIEEHRELSRRMAGCPRPWIAVLIGGSASPDRLDDEAVAKLAEAGLREASRSGGSLIVITSPRTGPRRDQVIQARLKDAKFVQLWSALTGLNMYGAVLAEADRFIVTSDSISMATEALHTGKPVSVFVLPQVRSIGMRVAAALSRPSPLRGLVSNLFKGGVIEPPPDRLKFYRELVGKGVLAFYPGVPERSGRGLFDEAASLAVLAVKKSLS
jgi:hypothetical protein